MKTKIFMLIILTIILSFLTANVSLSRNGSNNKTEKNQMIHSDKISSAEKLRTALRQLWEDHIVWTRNVILNLVDDLPGTNETVNRLLKNQEDIGNAIKPYYGDAAGEKLTSLLKPHITIAAEVVKAAKKGDKAGLDDADKRWHANAEEISVFLSSANPNWKKDDLQSMMNDHLKYTTDEAVARIKKDYDADIKAYDKVHEEILMMSDDLANGIINQFPDKFND
ncbi:MAG TPA: hypothetical protein VLM39_00645 [Ignavibacteriaceae bacterium]|nr:hypothetical protein [Ignavibacteriaceae bacterium]